MYELVRTLDVYYTKTQLMQIVDGYIQDSSTSVTSFLASRGEQYALGKLSTKMSETFWGNVYNTFSSFMSFANFRQVNYESLQRELVWEAFRQIDAYGGRGAVRFRTSVYKTGTHDRAVAFEYSILYGPNF